MPIHFKNKTVDDVMKKLTAKVGGLCYPLPVAYFNHDQHTNHILSKDYATVDFIELCGRGTAVKSDGEYCALLSHNELTDSIMNDRNETLLYSIPEKYDKHIVTSKVKGYETEWGVLVGIYPMFTPIKDTNVQMLPHQFPTAREYFYSNGFKDSLRLLNTLAILGQSNTLLLYYLDDITNWVVVNGEHKLLII